MQYSYRHCGAPQDLIFTEAVFEGRADDPEGFRPVWMKSRPNAKPANLFGRRQAGRHLKILHRAFVLESH